MYDTRPLVLWIVIGALRESWPTGWCPRAARPGGAIVVGILGAFIGGWLFGVLESAWEAA
jgi:uncharacterized membrane protein YeaQ/YmgE (transglycosylase-associated protein family)